MGEGDDQRCPRDSMPTNEATTEGDAADPLAVPPQTPLYRAFNVSRYGRQDAIKAIQEATGRKLVCYVAEPTGALTRDDVMPLMDLLHRVPIGANVDFLLHTSGGDIDAAEKERACSDTGCRTRASFESSCPTMRRAPGRWWNWRT